MVATPFIYSLSITKIIKHESTYQRKATLTRKKYTNRFNVELGIGIEL